MFAQGTGWIPDRPDPRDYGPGHKNLTPALGPSGMQDAIAQPAAPLDVTRSKMNDIVRLKQALNQIGPSSIQYLMKITQHNSLLVISCRNHNAQSRHRNQTE